MKRKHKVLFQFRGKKEKKYFFFKKYQNFEEDKDNSDFQRNFFSEKIAEFQVH